MKLKLLLSCIVLLAAVSLAVVFLVTGHSEPEIKDPFFGLYQDVPLETVSFEGTIQAASLIPDPAKNDYDNCLYALFIELNSVLSNHQKDGGIANEAIIVVSVMKDKTIIRDNVFLPGDKISCTCAKYDDMPQVIQEIQLSDDIQSFEHQQYYVLSSKKIPEFRKTGNRSFSEREITILPLQTMPRDDNAAELRKERIGNEIKRIEDEIRKHGGSFQTWKEEYAPVKEQYSKLCDEQYKAWLDDSFYAANPGETEYHTRDYIEGITPYKKYLEENNIDLIIVRVPTKQDFARCVLGADTFLEDPAWVEHYYECLKNDIEIIDPMREMWEHRFDYPLFYFYNIPLEHHPFEGHAIIAAEVLSETLKRYDYPKSDRPITLADTSLETEDPRFFWPEGNEKFDPHVNLKFKQAVQNNETIGGLHPNTGSPFIFVSNSYFYYPNRDLGASLPAYTAYFLQTIPDWFYQNALGNPALKNLVMAPELLHHRYAVIMVGDPRRWSGGFLDFPQYLYDHPKRMTLKKTLDILSPDDITFMDADLFQFKKDKKKEMALITHRTSGKDDEKKDTTDTFTFQIDIPSFKDKKMCLLRFNHETRTGIKFVISDKENGTVLEQSAIANNTNVHSDFYIPVQADSPSRTILIQVKMSDPYSKYYVKNIELWYY